MKKLFLACLIGMGMLLPTISNTTTAAVHFRQRIINTQISDWHYIVNSQESDGQILLVEIISMSTGKTVIAQKGTGYSASVDLRGLPSGGYVGRTTCQYNSLSQQFKL